MLLLAVGTGAFAVVALYEGVNAWRISDKRRLRIAVAAFVILSAAAGACGVVGLRYPIGFNAFDSGFGGGWVCRNLGSAAALVCHKSNEARGRGASLAAPRMS